MDWCECLLFQNKLGFVDAKSMLDYCVWAEKTNPNFSLRKNPGLQFTL